MKKMNIVKEKKDFDLAFRLRNQFSSKYFYVYVRDNKEGKYRFGICISKKTGIAVKRNKYKRVIKDIIDKSKLQFSNKKSAIGAKYIELNIDLINVLKKIN